ncbi:MAG: hypothetical protein GX221_09185 [Candidatus Riflebacteria bacterium]|nr:hypothetical protein [Candidatus Riflebacteria bacterium]
MKNTSHEIISLVRDKAAAKGIKALFFLHEENSSLMRLRDSAVSMNTSEHLTRLDIKVFGEKNIGHILAMGNIADEDYVEGLLYKAAERAKVNSGMTKLPALPVIEKSIEIERQFDTELAELDSIRKADFYKKVMEKTGTQYSYSGSWSSGSVKLFATSTANTNSLMQKLTDQSCNLVLQHPKKYWELKQIQNSWKFSALSPEKMAKDFLNILPIYEKNEGVRLENGRYRVLFGPQALGTLVELVVSSGFTANLYEEKQSWTSKFKKGDRILPENISIIDDPSEAYVFGRDFDDCGILRTAFPLIENGKLGNIAYKFQEAAYYQKQPTGHDKAIDAVMKPGKDTKDPLEAMKSYDKVLYVPFLHYPGIPNLSKGLFTASTRFNAMLWENGKFVAPIFSSRITDTLENIFGNISKMSSESVMANMSTTYAKREPIGISIPSYIISDNVNITDSAVSF